jgi:CheY-like chemotaxis protein
VRILVVDDYLPFALSVKMLLSGEHDVQVAEGGRKALERLLAGETFDLMLCDVSMPDLSGEDVYEALRSARPGLERKLVFLSGGATSEAAERFLARVDNRRIDKPFEATELLELVRSVKP